MMGAGPSAASPRVPLVLAQAWGPRSPKPALRGMGAGLSAASPRAPLVLAQAWGPRSPKPALRAGVDRV